MVRAHVVSLICLCAVWGCNDNGSTEPADRCNASELPFRGQPNAPTVVDARLELIESGVVVHVTVTDDQGDADLRDVEQSVTLFSRANCEGTRVTLVDDFAGSGVEESFGTAALWDINLSLRAAMGAADRWPLEVDIRDRAGNRTTGRVFATVVDE